MKATVTEIADGIHRISTAVDALPGGFTFNQFLIADEQPLLFHTGPRQLFPLVREAIARVLPVETLRWVAFSHGEQDESGTLADFLTLAPHAQALSGRIGKMLVSDDKVPGRGRGLADGEELSIGKRTVVWFDAPHVPHGWDCGFLGEKTTRTLFCGDLFTQAGGANLPAVTESDILGPSEGMRRAMDYYAHGPNTKAVIERLAATKPATLACMHGSSFRGDGESLLRALAGALRPIG